MKKSKPFFLFFITCFVSTTNLLAMANNPSNMLLAGRGSGGRLGDNILLYCKAKYIAFKYGLPLVYRSFPFFDQLALSKYENLYTNAVDRLYPTHTILTNCRDVLRTNSKSTLFEVCYFCQMRKKNDNSQPYVGCAEFPFDWIKRKMTKYPEFGNELRRNLQVLDIHTRYVPLARNCITVGVSTRMGCGGDDPFLYSEQFFSDVVVFNAQPEKANTKYLHADQGNPFKFVPQQFYINQVKRLSAMLRDNKMHIYLFIDKDKDVAEEILAKWRVALANYKNITIECNVEKKWQERILDDLYYMSKCDCLIRGCSHFSGIAQLAGEHKIIFGPDPMSYIWLNEKHLVFGKTFVYFQNVKRNKFERCVYENTDKNELIAMADEVFEAIL